MFNWVKKKKEEEIKTTDGKKVRNIELYKYFLQHKDETLYLKLETGSIRAINFIKYCVDFCEDRIVYSYIEFFNGRVIFEKNDTTYPFKSLVSMTSEDYDNYINNLLSDYKRVFDSMAIGTTVRRIERAYGDSYRVVYYKIVRKIKNKDMYYVEYCTKDIKEKEWSIPIMKEWCDVNYIFNNPIELEVEPEYDND